VVDRAVAAVLAGKAVGAASRRLGRGGGTALPGLVAERLEPGIVARLARSLGHGSAIVTGTNGKTTTSRMLAGVLAAAGLPVVHNRSGSNLMRGLAATLTEAGGLDGRIPNAAGTAGVFEVDEATLPRASEAIRPRAVTFTNLCRDQLDRYGEVDSIAALWREAVRALPLSSTVVLNADDPSVAVLRHDARGPALSFGIEDPTVLTTGEEHPADARWCGLCGTEFSYTARFFWHVGHWSCSGCGDRRPAPDVSATRVDAGRDRTRLELSLPWGRLEVELPLSGLYNVYNALAAATAAVAMEASPAAIRKGLESFSAAFGRQETLRVRGRDVRVLLCKNPAGVNQVLRTVLMGEEPLHLLLILNDDIADGRDVSWIWDVDFELLAGRVETLVASGSRAADMALRLKYAGLGDRVALEQDVHAAVGRALAQTPAGARLHVLPTYTAMLGAREHLAALAGSPRFWEQ
jgi:UDP-N-acetylmuramyl tripeptide synthase